MNKETKDDTIPPDSPTNKRSFPIYIRPDLFVLVDSKGYILGTCAEGSLGCVVQGIGPDARFAIKVPRLLADTIRENAFIVKITEEELKNVLKAGKFPGLIPANLTERRLMKFRRAGLANDRSNDDACKQEDGVLFISFEKERNPRLCSVNFVDNKLTLYPPDAAPELASAMTKEIWSRLAASDEDVHGQFGRTVFFSVDEKKVQSLREGVLETTASALMQSNTWYSAVPAILYDWATGSLQEAIAKLHIKKWSFKDHFLLFKEILTGVRSLHAKGMLHADIRPANIMCTESPNVGPADPPDLSDPKLYRLADYGSFGDPNATGFGGAEDTGNTMIGPGVGAQRVTPFYSRERRTGVERETADTAIIFQIDPSTPQAAESEGFFIRLGWRTQLLRPNTNQINADMLAAIAKHRELLKKNDIAVRFTTSDSLQPGDRLRLREYVFEITKAGQVDEDLICFARRKFARVIHDRLAVYDPKGVITEKVLSLSNYVELRQWSAATDLYSVGAICLYTLFCTGIQRHGLPKSSDSTSQKETQPNPSESAPQKRAPSPTSEITSGQPSESPTPPATTIDSLFGDLISVLESVPHFKIFWAQLELFRAEFESYLKAEPEASSDAIQNHITSNKKTLLQIATDATNQLCQSAPHAKVILLQFEMNLAHFVLFMHFIMSCLHRQSHLDRTTDKDRADAARSSAHLPFAANRTESPSGKAAERALRRLEELERYHQKEDRLKGFVKKPGDIPDFNPKPNVEILEEKAKAEEDKAKAEEEMAKAVELRKKAEYDLQVARERMRELAARWGGRIEHRRWFVPKKDVTELIDKIQKVRDA